MEIGQLYPSLAPIADAWGDEFSRTVLGAPEEYPALASIERARIAWKARHAKEQRSQQRPPRKHMWLPRWYLRSWGGRAVACCATMWWLEQRWYKATPRCGVCRRALR